MTEPEGRVTAEVDLSAIEQNCRGLGSRLGDGTLLCAVVKADGYGHGIAESAGAALRGGAERLAVVTALEAETLRRSVGGDVPILVMGALTATELRRALAARVEVGVWRAEFLEQVIRVSEELGTRSVVHVKHDSGMGRLGERDPKLAADLAFVADGAPGIELGGVWTHLATADEPDTSYMRAQLAAFGQVADRVRAVAPECLLHAANSAATLAHPASHFDMVRCGVAIYGLDPFQRDPRPHNLEPALRLTSHVAAIKTFEPGASAGYGRRWKAQAETQIGVIPIGYGDGYRRALSGNAEVLVGGRRHPVVGSVSMDNITIDLGATTDVSTGDEAVLIGTQGSELILAEELAARIGTINYEVTTGILPRVPRSYRR